MNRFITVDNAYDYDYSRPTLCCPKRVQNKCIEDWSPFTSNDLYQIRMIIEKDEADKFESFLGQSEIKLLCDDVLLNYAGCNLCPYSILGKICHHHASKCANVLLSHTVGSMMDLNIQNCYGSYPLHDAAITLSSCLVKLLLDHGAIRETRFLDPVTSQNISPLDYAVERLSCDKNLINWSPKKSVFKLIITLCLPQMKEALETIALLATTTILPDAIFNAVKRGQVVPVAALLLVARDRVLGGVSFSGNMVSSGPLVFPKSIMNELATLINQEYALMGRKEHTAILQLCLEKKELLIYILQMLEIFNRAGPALDSYWKTTSDVPNEQVSNDVAELLKKAGFPLSTKDTDIRDIMSSPKSDPVLSDVNMEQQGYNAEDDAKGILFKPRREQLCRCDVKNPSCTTSNVFHRIVGTSFSYSQHREFSSHANPSIHQPLWTIPRRDIGFLPCSSKVFGKVEPQDKIKTTVKEKSGKWPQLQMSNRVFRSGFILVAALKRRGLRGV